MAQNSDPYENALAERINRILKQEFMIDKYSKEAKIKTKLSRNLSLFIMNLDLIVQIIC